MYKSEKQTFTPCEEIATSSSIIEGSAGVPIMALLRLKEEREDSFRSRSVPAIGASSVLIRSLRAAPALTMESREKGEVLQNATHLSAKLCLPTKDGKLAIVWINAIPAKREIGKQGLLTFKSCCAMVPCELEEKGGSGAGGGEMVRTLLRLRGYSGPFESPFHCPKGKGGQGEKDGL